MNALNRRVFLSGPLGLALAGCSRPAARQPSPVAIVRAPDYTQAIYATVRQALREFRPQLRGKRVLLKPNLVEFEPGTPINTHPLLVHAALEAFRELGAEVVIGEGPGHRRNTLDLAEAAGYFNTIPGFERLFTDLNLDDIVELPLRRPHSRLRSVYVARSACRCDLLVSMPKMKTHHWVGATLSMKNLFGTVSGGVYGWPKNILHWAGIAECVADLYHALPRHFAIVDGIVGMEGNGPIQGTPKNAGVIVAGPDLGAVDATCCRIMSIDPCKVAYIKMAAGDMDAQSVQQVGERIDRVRAPFALLPEWADIGL